MRHFRTALLVVLAWLAYRAPAQEKEIAEMWRDQLDTAAMNYYRPEYLIIDEAEMLSLFDRQPSFGMYKDNYFITGIPLSGKIDKHTADVKFQISVRQRLTRTVLPFNTSLSLTYTQKSFWNLYMKSAPFEDNNYNPGFALVKPLIYKNQLRGSAVLALEHESNGKDSLDSRGWNYVTLTGVYFFNASFTLQAKVWAGIMDRGETAADGDGGNPDLYKYRGYGLVAMNYRSLNDRFWASVVINPRNRFRSANIQLELNFKMNSNVNQYLFVQWYNGYGESLLEYNRYASMIRVGICIKPALRNLY